MWGGGGNRDPKSREPASAPLLLHTFFKGGEVITTAKSFPVCCMETLARWVREGAAFIGGRVYVRSGAHRGMVVLRPWDRTQKRKTKASGGSRVSHPVHIDVSTTRKTTSLVTKQNEALTKHKSCAACLLDAAIQLIRLF